MTRPDWKRGDVLRSNKYLGFDSHFDEVVFFDYMEGRTSFITADGTELLSDNFKRVGHVTYDPLLIEVGCDATLIPSGKQVRVLAIDGEAVWIREHESNYHETYDKFRLKRLP